MWKGFLVFITVKIKNIEDRWYHSLKKVKIQWHARNLFYPSYLFLLEFMFFFFSWQSIETNCKWRNASIAAIVLYPVFCHRQKVQPLSLALYYLGVQPKVIQRHNLQQIIIIITAKSNFPNALQSYRFKCKLISFTNTI